MWESVCVYERRNTGGKSVSSGLPEEEVMLKEATAAAPMLSLSFVTVAWVLCFFSFFIAVFPKLAGSTDYFLALYKTCHALCSIRFLMQETIEPPICRKLSYEHGKFLSLMFVYQRDWEGSREPVTDTWASFKKSCSLFLSQFCCLGVNISSSTTSWEWTSLKYNWECIIKQKLHRAQCHMGFSISRQADHGAKCKTQLYLDCTIMLDQCNTLKIRRQKLSFSYVGFCLVPPLTFLL